MRSEDEIKNKIKHLYDEWLDDEDASLDDVFDIRKQIRLLEWVLETDVDTK